MTWRTKPSTDAIGPPGPVFVLGLARGLLGVEQPEVEVGRKPGVVEHVPVAPHRVLVGPEAREAPREEVGARGARLRAGDRQVEAGGAPDAVPVTLHLAHHSAREGIRDEAGGHSRRRLAARQRPAVQLVVVPAPADGRPALVDQNAERAAQPPVERLHRIAAAGRYVGRRGVAVHQELRARDDLDRHAEPRAQPLLEPSHVPAAGRHHDKAPRPPGAHVRTETRGVVRRPPVIDAVPVLAEGRGVVAHRAQQQHELLPVIGQATQAPGALHHDDLDALAARPGTRHRRVRLEELVAEDPDRRHGELGCIRSV